MSCGACGAFSDGASLGGGGGIVGAASFFLCFLPCWAGSVPGIGLGMMGGCWDGSWDSKAEEEEVEDGGSFLFLDRDREGWEDIACLGRGVLSRVVWIFREPINVVLVRFCEIRKFNTACSGEVDARLTQPQCCGR